MKKSDYFIDLPNNKTVITAKGIYKFMNNEIITTHEAANIIAANAGLSSFSASQVRRLCDNGEITAEKKGATWYVDKQSAENYKPKRYIKSVGEK